VPLIRPTRAPVGLFLLSLGIATVGCRAADTQECGPYWPGAPLSVAAMPADPPPIRLVELWRAGGSAPGQEMAEPTSIAASSRGAAAVVDFGLARVIVIGPQGEWLGSWGRQGRGPGELTMPVAANWSGDTLVVFDIDQSKVVRYLDSEFVAVSSVPADFVAPVAMTGSIDYVAVAADGGVLLQQPLAAATSPDSSILAVLVQRPGAPAPDTVVAATVRHVEWDRSRIVQPGAARPAVAVGADGWLARTAGDGSWRIAWGRGDVRVQLCAPLPAVPSSAEERGEGDVPGGFEEAFSAIARTPPPTALNRIGRVLVSSAGELWVDRRRPLPFSREQLFGATGGTMDVFDSTGHYLGRVAIPERVSIQALSDSTVIGIEFSDLDEATIIGYRLVR
jgi:hypothetical protein